MIVACIVSLLGLLAWWVRLPVFEGVLGVLLATPLVVYPFGGPGEIAVVTYATVLGALLVFLWLCQRTGEQFPRGAFLDSFESLGVFLVLFLLNYSLCLLWPDFIAMGERLRDYAILASVEHSPIVPREPWLAGATLNYYLYWYRFGDLLGAIGGLEVWQTYPQLQSFTFALFATALFHLMRRFLSIRPEIALPLAMVIAYGSNVAGVVGFLKGDDNWWGPSRVIPGAINEFPAWSFLLGDLHPHFLNLGLSPFLLVVALGLLRRGDLVGRVGLAALIIITPGWFFNGNAWEVPLCLGWIALTLVVFGVTQWGRGTWSSLAAKLREAGREPRFWGIAFGGALVVFSLYLSSRNIAPGDTPLKLVSGAIPRTGLLDLLRHWGVPLTLIATCLIALRSPGSDRRLAVLLVGVSLLSREALPFLGALAVLAFWRTVSTVLEQRRIPPPVADVRLVFQALGFGALALLILPEFVFLDDPYGGENERMNTIFKIYAAVWFAVHLYAVTLVCEVAQQVKLSSRQRGGALLIGGVSAILLCGFFVRTIELRRTKERVVLPYAQGLSEISRRFPGAGETIQELMTLPRGVVLEAQGPAYDYTTHVATLSGNDAFLGWANHVNLLTRAYGEVSRREGVTRDLYVGSDCAIKRETLTREGIAYVVLGPLERKAYPGIDGASFGCLREVIARGDYRVFAL